MADAFRPVLYGLPVLIMTTPSHVTTLSPRSSASPLPLRAVGALLLVLALFALFSRSIQLDLRPMHTDEAVHASKLGILLETGQYIYDPHEYHGPTIYYFARPLVRLSGASTLEQIRNSIPLRLVPVFFGAALVLLPLLFLNGLGPTPVAVAAVLAVVSPAFAFYSRYYIQEILMVFFTWAAIGCAWRYVQRPAFSWALLAGASIGFMQATKETSVIAYTCGVTAAGLVVVAAHGLEHQHREPWVQMRLRHLAAAVVLAAFFTLLCLTNFGKNPAAALDTFRTYTTYLGRAGTGDGHGTGAGAHVQPWYFYFKTLIWSRAGRGPWWSEAMIIALALIGFLPALRPQLLPQANRHLLRYLVLFTTSMAAIYSLIPYKTPWNMLTFHYGFILLAGVGAAVLLHCIHFRWGKGAVALLLVAGAMQLAAQAYRATIVYPADSRNPYVYGHTSTNLRRLVERIEDLAEVHPDKHRMVIHVVAPGDDYWPLPWDLRRFENVGFWNELPPLLNAPVVVTAPALVGQTEQALPGTYLQEFYGLRPDVLLTLFIEESLWETFLKTRTGDN